jgi:hypothetical protein
LNYGPTPTDIVDWFPGAGATDGATVIVTRSFVVNGVDVPVAVHVWLVPVAVHVAIAAPPFLAKLTVHEAVPLAGTSTQKLMRESCIARGRMTLKTVLVFFVTAAAPEVHRT